MYEYRRLTPEQRRELVESRLSRGFPPHSPPHFQLDNATYLLTAACYEHATHMLTPERRQQLLDRLFAEAIAAGIELLAWVVLPNHYHCLAHVESMERLQDVFRGVHGSTSFAWNRADGAAGRKVWYRYSDRFIRSEAHFYTTLNYVHFNPVKHGWVTTPYEWAESSVH
jgi:putative transposase